MHASDEIGLRLLVLRARVLAMLASEQRRRQREAQREGSLESQGECEFGNSLAGGKRIFSKDTTPPPRLIPIKDTSGRDMPPSERAPMPKKP